MLDRLKNKAEAVQAKVSGGVAAVQTKIGSEVAALSTSIEEVAPVLEALGYQVVGARITLGLPPSAAIGISGLSKPVDAARFEALIEANADNRPVLAVLKALQHIVKVQSSVRIKGLIADLAEVKLGTPPSVTLMFGRAGGGYTLPTG